ncbi:hypothetical protein LCGC14_2501640, partial [marine sediment metagenome]
GQTRYYSLSYFDFGDQLDTPLNVQKEINRFVMIDKQLYGLYNVFGNGVINGWLIEDKGYTTDTGISISITTGIGIIKFMAGETSLPGGINHLETNTILYIYAVWQGNTVRDRLVFFTASTLSSLGDFAVKLANVTNNLSISFEEGAFTESINVENSNTSKLYSLYGIECFIGDFTYVNYIKHPIFLNILDNDNWIISNSSIPYISDDNIVSNNEEDVVITDLVEFNPTNQQIVFSTDYVKFSDFTLGSMIEYETGIFLVVGLRTGTTLGGITGNDLLSSYSETNPAPEKVKFRAAALDSLDSYRGSIITIDKINNKYDVFYTSPDGLYPSDVNMYDDGRLLVSESSFGEASGRLIILDAWGNVVKDYGQGTFNVISDAKILNNNHIMVSV